MISALTKNILILVIGSSLCLVFVVWVLLPAAAKVDSLNTELIKQKTQIANLQQQILAYQTAEADLNRATQQQDIFNAVVVKENMVQPIAELEAGLGNSKATHEVLSIQDPFPLTIKPGSTATTSTSASTATTASSQDDSTPATTKTKGPAPIVGGLTNITLVPYNLEFTNDYLGVIDLLSYMEHLPNFTEVSSFTLKSQNVGDSSAPTALHTGLIDASINGVFFAKKDSNGN